MSFKKIEARLVVGARYGTPTTTGISLREVPYDGRHITSFYSSYGVELKDVRATLRLGRIGSVFELERGQVMIVPSA